MEKVGKDTEGREREEGGDGGWDEVEKVVVPRSPARQTELSRATHRDGCTVTPVHPWQGTELICLYITLLVSLS